MDEPVFSHLTGPARPAPPVPKRSAQNASVNPPNEENNNPTKEQPRPRPEPPPSIKSGSARQTSSKRERPVITVVDARPMDQVGFREVSPNVKPDATENATRLTADSEEQHSTITMRQKSRGPAPPRPASMPAKPPPPKAPSVRQQHAMSQAPKLPGAYGDRILVVSPEAAAENTEAARKVPPPRPVSRPQSLHFTGKGSSSDIPSESSGYGSQLPTSDSQSSLSGSDTQADAPPLRKKPIGVQVMPFGPGMLPSRGQLKSPTSPRSQPSEEQIKPIPSPRASRKEFSSPSPRPRPRSTASPVPDIKEPEPVPVMVLPPVPKPRFSPAPQPASSPAETETTPADTHNASLQIIPTTNVSQDSQVSPNSVKLETAPDSSRSREKLSQYNNRSPSPLSNRPTVKPKLSPKPRPSTPTKLNVDTADAPHNSGSSTTQLSPSLPIPTLLTKEIPPGQSLSMDALKDAEPISSSIKQEKENKTNTPHFTGKVHEFHKEGETVEKLQKIVMKEEHTTKEAELQDNDNLGNASLAQSPMEEAISKVLVKPSQLNDSFSDDEPDPFYTRKGQHPVIDSSLFSLMAAKKDDDTEETKMKKYFSETEIREKENTDPAEAFYRDRPEILSPETAVKPTRLKRPTIIRPKKMPSMEAPTEKVGKVEKSPPEKPPTPTSVEEEEPKVETPGGPAPVIAKRPTIIRALRQRAQQESRKERTSGKQDDDTQTKKATEDEQKSTEVQLRPKKVPPPVKPKPKSMRSSQEIASPVLPAEGVTASPPKDKPTPPKKKPAIPPPVKPKPKKPPTPTKPLSELLPQDPAGTESNATEPIASPIQPVASSKLICAEDIASSHGSITSLEEAENMMNEMRVRRDSGSSGQSGQQEDRSVSPEKEKKWVPPGAVCVMGMGGMPPPLPRTGPVAVSTPDLRIIPEASPDISGRTHRLSIQRSHSPPPRPTPVRPLARARPKSMMSLNQQSTDIVKHSLTPSEENISGQNVEVSSHKRTAPARPMRPAPLLKKPVSVETGPIQEDERSESPKVKHAPIRPVRPMSPLKKKPPSRAPPPKVSATVQRDRGIPPALPTRPGPGHPLFHYVVQGPHGIAMFDYTASADDELSFKAGDVIQLEAQVGEAWMSGQNVDKKGIFPANFIEIIEAPPISESMETDRTPVAKQSNEVAGIGPRCIARFDYESEVEGDLNFTCGDMIALMDRVGDEWLKGKLEGKEGVFPIAFVEVVEDLPAPCDPAPSPKATTAGSGQSDENTVIATFDYSGQTGDLSLQKGDKVKVLSKLNDEWLFGQGSDGSCGVFPLAYVDRMPLWLPSYTPVSKVVQNAVDLWKGQDEEAHCMADYDFVGEEGDLMFQKGDKITLTEHVNADWLKGTIGGRSGTFPKAFVTIVKDLEASKPVTESPVPVASPSPTGKAVVLHDFVAENEGDLSLKVGDDVVLLKKVNDEWYSGKIGERQGMFPAGFIKVIKPLSNAQEQDSYA